MPVFFDANRVVGLYGMKEICYFRHGDTNLFHAALKIVTTADFDSYRLILEVDPTIYQSRFLTADVQQLAQQ